MTTAKKIDSSKLAKACAELADKKLGENVLTLKLDPSNSIADYFVICTAKNSTHLQSLGSQMERGIRDELKIRPQSASGDARSGWILIDYASVVVHIMTAEARDRYSLESLWGDAPQEEAIKQLNGKIAR